MAVGPILRACMTPLVLTAGVAAPSGLALGSVAGLSDVGDAWRALLLGAPPSLH